VLGSSDHLENNVHSEISQTLSWQIRAHFETLLREQMPPFSMENHSKKW